MIRGKYKTRFTAKERFNQKIVKFSQLGCWHWAGATNGHGYGLFWFDGRMVKAHHFALGMPKCEVVMHTCDNPLCVNPAHLKTGTHRDNASDRSSKGRSAGTKKTHCPAGHEYNSSNTYRHGNRRHCKICKRENLKRFRKQRAEAYFK